MNNRGDKTLSLLTQASCLLFFTGFIFSFRAVVSIGIALVLLCRLIEYRHNLPVFFKRIKTPFLAACTLFFALQIISLLYTHNTHEGWSNVQLKSALVFIPLAFYDLQKEINRKLITSYCILVLLASLYCLLFAARDYSQTLDESLFFYHRLARQLSHHAVYFSVFVFIALVLLLENFRSNSIVLNKLFSVSAIVFLSIFLFLLSSKLVIAFYLLYLLYYFVVLLKKNKTKRVLIILLFTCILVAGGTAVIIRNPVSNRFYEIIYSDMRLVNQDKFDPADYFDGLQFRILQWKFVPEILNRTQSWWFGVSPGGAQALLDQEYTSKHMYTGDGQHSRGLLGYNTHNQFLQALLQTGLIGLMAFLFIFICLAGMAWQIRRTGYVFIILLLLAWLFSESAFETQYGILIFTFFPIFFTHTEMELFPARKKVPDFPEKQALPHFIKSEST